MQNKSFFIKIIYHCFSFKNVILLVKLLLSAIDQSWSFPTSHYDHHFSFLQQPSAILVPSGLNFLVNGLPYQITVNGNKLEPQPNYHPAYVVNPTDSPVTWVSGSWGLNGRPINLQRWPESINKSWRPVHLG